MCTYHINISIENFQYKQDEVENKLISVIFAGKKGKNMLQEYFKEYYQVMF